MNSHDVIKAYDARKQERSQVSTIWELIERFILPFGGQFQEQYGNIDWKLREIYDSTGINANQLLASNIQSSLTNPATNWANYSYGNDKLNKDKMAVQWKQDCEHEVMTRIRSGNYNNEAGSFFLDLTSFGSGFQIQEALETETGDLDKIVFDTVSPGECCFDLTLDGFIRNFYREYHWTATQIVDKFGDEVPAHIKEAAEKTDCTEKFEVVFCIWTRKLDKQPNTFQILSADQRPFGGKYVLRKGREPLGKEIGYYEMPVSHALWRSVSGSDWGFSPAMVAIWHVLSLNHLNELILKGGEKVVDPAILTTNRGVFGSIDLGAAGVTVVSDINAIQTFESKARFDVSQMNKRELEAAIKDMFYWDQLQLKESPAMTAYEVQARIQLMNRFIGPTYGRLQTHYLDPTLERYFKILYRYKKLPEMPPIVAELGGKLIINYTGPLAAAQRMADVQNLEATLQGIAGIAQQYPSAADKIDIDAAIDEYVYAKGVTTKILRSKENVKQIRDNRMQQRQAEMQMQQAQTAADVMQKTGGPNAGQ